MMKWGLGVLSVGLLLFLYHTYLLGVILIVFGLVLAFKGNKEYKLAQAANKKKEEGK